MTNDQIFAVSLSCISITGALIGAWFNPFISNKLDSLKAKRKLKSELSRNIYIFFMLRKSSFDLVDSLSIGRINNAIMRHELESGSLSPDVKKRKEEEIALHTTELFDMNKQSDDVFNKQMEIESTIIGILGDVHTHYGKRMFDRLYELVNVHIENSNTPDQFIDYSILTTDEIKTALGKRGKLVHKKWKELDAERVALIEEIFNHWN